MFIEALFIIAKMCIQPKCPSTNEWIKKVWYVCTHTHTHNVISVRKKNKIMPFAAIWVDLGGIVPSEKREKDKYYMISLIYTDSKKYK